jgi:hypothetical protein
MTAQRYIPDDSKLYERCDLLVDRHKIMSRWMDYFCQLLNVQDVGY